MKMLFFVIFMIVGFIFSFFYEANHNSKVPAVFIFMIIAAIIGVILFPEKPEYETHCERCDIDLMYDDAVADNRDDHFCYPCALEYLKYCNLCEEYYDTFDYESNSGCCENCTYEYFESCYFCGGYDCNENNAVSINVNGENYYSCPECMTSYIRKNSISFKN